MKGQVIGINSSIRTASSGSSDPFGGSSEGGSIGLGFAIPIDTVKTIAQELISTGKAVHATLGVNTRSVTDGVKDGALVLNVEPNGPGAKAGIREQDVVIAVDGKSVGSSEELQVAVDAHKPGDTVSIQLVRGGGSTTVQATLATA